MSTLSGGNQQKVVLAKWLATEPRVLIVDEPTRGIDVGTKAEVHRLLSELAADGVAVLMVSSELPEVLGMADRVLVMHEGRLVAEIPRDRADEESVMFAATGQREAAAHDATVGTSAASPRAPAESRRARRGPCVHRLFVVRELGILLALVLLVAVTAIDNPRFLSAQSVKDLLLGSTILAILAVGQAIVIITRNVDLSVGSILGPVRLRHRQRSSSPRPGTPIVVVAARRDGPRRGAAARSTAR